MSMLIRISYMTDTLFYKKKRKTISGDAIPQKTCGFLPATKGKNSKLCISVEDSTTQNLDRDPDPDCQPYLDPDPGEKKLKCFCEKNNFH